MNIKDLKLLILNKKIIYKIYNCNTINNLNKITFLKIFFQQLFFQENLYNVFLILLNI